MLYVKPEVVEALSKVLPTYYEDFVDENTAIPCISYKESGNYDNRITCNSCGYSDIYYTVKVWGNDIDTLSQNAAEVSDAMRELGFKRNSYNEMGAGNLKSIVMIFNAIGFELF